MTRDTTSVFAQGAVIVPDFITPAEEARILQRIGEAPWLAELSRRVQHYGYRYDYLRREPPGPRRALRALGRGRWRTGSGSAFRRRSPPVQCIVNEYRPGQGIGMHADHADFGPVVASLSLADDWPMQFRCRTVRPYTRDALPDDEVAVLPRRSVLVLAGPARSAFMHGIDRNAGRRRRATRISATFRTLTSGAGRP